MVNKSKKEQILRVASNLFNKQGIRATGVDQVVAESQVAKMTLYNHFPSKDKLVLAYLERQDEQWRGWFQSSVEQREDTPQKRLLAVYDVLGEWFAAPEFTGCAFIKTASEYLDHSHPYFEATQRYKIILKNYIRELVEQSDFKKPEALASALYLLVEGAITAYMLQSDTESADHAKNAAAILIQNFKDN
ncbi:TetR/AcrR family transcriptional regulator [Saccharibacillus sp. JS10]|uniref:TetR/AcrR family transcriptional regulator n=1 Tax=Saccharibacillus sp. JS10 TaxID=2950552 RepID=UPI002109F94E|nr:TetR/AcrR family transcriptional regulator [Saccharibacillus sp. JS10]MCQ4088334.1 TetR/AcrR family transcriptional regulator [Saccharibacillus sp. JS10]